MIAVVIVEDHKNVGNVMRRLLESKHPDIKVMAICPYIKEAEEMLHKFSPDLVFMDVELGKSQTCFDLLKRISPINFSIIFTTAYSRTAIQAFKLCSIDYLIKPVDENELETAIANFRRKKDKIDSAKIEGLINAWDNSGNQQNKLHFTTEEGHGQVTISDIVFCEGINNQTLLILNNKRKMLINRSLKECEDTLAPYKFYRIQKSYLINLNQVKKYNKWKDETTLLMSNDVTLRVSSGLKDKFLENLKFADSLNPFNKLN